MYVIYGLVDKEGQVFYVGHTKDIKERIKGHGVRCFNDNSNNTNYPVYKHIRENNIEIKYVILEENITEEDKSKKEREWHDKYNDLCNQVIPDRSWKEYYQENKEKIAEYQKEYRENNKERIKEKDKQYYEKNREKRRQPWTCEICNKQLHGHRSRHLKLHE